MGIDSLKGGGASIPVGQPRALEASKPIETTAAPLAKTPAAPPEGFDDPKKKLVSVTGGYKAFVPSFPVREDLQALLAQQRGGASARPIADSSAGTIAERGAAPPERTAEADFKAQAKAAGAKTDAQIEAKACALAKAAIEKEFGMKVKNGDAKWTAEDLTRAYESFKAMPEEDRKNLEGLDLIRDHVAPPEVQAEAGDDGVTAGLYSPNVDADGDHRAKAPSITAYDAAYDGMDREQTESVLLHEAGHAVANRPYDDAMAAENIAVNASNAKSAAVNAALADDKSAWGTEVSAANDFARHAPHDKATRTFYSAQQAVHKALDEVDKAKSPAALQKAEAKLDQAKAKRDAAQAALTSPKAQQLAQAWVDGTNQAEPTAKAYAEAHIDYVAAKKVTTAAHAEVAKLKGKGDESKEVTAFEKARHSESPPSSYGKKTHDEGYAEAYALYQRDPAYMKKHFPEQYAYFHGKKKSHPHRNDGD